MAPGVRDRCDDDDGHARALRGGENPSTAKHKPTRATKVTADRILGMTSMVQILSESVDRGEQEASMASGRVIASIGRPPRLLAPGSRGAFSRILIFWTHVTLGA